MMTQTSHREKGGSIKGNLKTIDRTSTQRVSTTNQFEFLYMGITSSSSSKDLSTKLANSFFKLPSVSHFSPQKQSENREYFFKLNKIRLLSKIGPNKFKQKLYHNLKRKILFESDSAAILSNKLSIIKRGSSPPPKSELMPNVEVSDSKTLIKQPSNRSVSISHSKSSKKVTVFSRQSIDKYSSIGLKHNDVSISCESLSGWEQN